jgi:PAS domain S-box-containing protein
VLEFNPAAERMFGYARDEAIGRELAELVIPPGLRERHREGLARAVATGESRVLGRRLELTGMRADGSELPVDLTIARLPLEGPPVFTGYIRERENAELEQAAFLADASAALDFPLDVQETLETIARLALPAGLADWCIVDAVDDAGEIVQAAIAHTDPDKLELVEELRREYPVDEAAEHGSARAVRTGESLLYPRVPDELLRAVAEDDRHLEVMRRLGFESAMVVPMFARGRTLAAITFVASERAPYGEADLAFAEELARRAATALENARLYTERTRVAKALQQSLLPPGLPEIPGVELASRFLPAGEGFDVGGDFYDVFEIAPSRLALFIGDVCGKGPDAAAVTALARYTLRAAAIRELEPSGVLRLLNEAMLRQRPDRRFCTVAYATLDLTGSGASLRVSSGGHPPPILLPAGGGAALLGRTGTLIGAFQDVDLRDTHAELRPGDTLVLYTDGVLEAGAPKRVLVPEDLAELLRAVPHPAPEDLAREIEESVLAPEARLRDDVAILVARIR